MTDADESFALAMMHVCGGYDSDPRSEWTVDLATLRALCGAYAASLESEAFALAANQCDCPIATENGYHDCGYRRERDEARADAARLREALAGFLRYFASGNSVPVERATIRTASAEVQQAINAMRGGRRD